MTEKKNEKRLGEHEELLPCALTNAEFEDRATKLAQANFDLQQHYGNEAEIKQHLKATEAKLEARRSELAMIVRNRKEPRVVRVGHFACFTEDVYQERREDTGDVTSERPLAPSERQQPLGLRDANGKP